MEAIPSLPLSTDGWAQGRLRRPDTDSPSHEPPRRERPQTTPASKDMSNRDARASLRSLAKPRAAGCMFQAA